MAAADTGQGIDVGDAVLHFLGDTTQLDSAFQKVQASADSNMKKAADSVGALDDSISSATDSATKAVPAVGAMGDSFSSLDKKVTRSEHSMREARESVEVLGETIGVHLPYAISTLASEIGPLGALLQEAFPILGALALIEVLGKLIAKHDALRVAEEHAGEVSAELTIKQNDLTQGLESANLQLDDQIAKLEGRPEANKLAIAMMAVKKSVDDLLATYESDFQKMDKLVDDQIGWSQKLKNALWDVALVTAEMASGQAGLMSQQYALDKNQLDQLEALKTARQNLQMQQEILADENVKDATHTSEAWKQAAEAVMDAAKGVKKSAEEAYFSVSAANPDLKELIGKLRDYGTMASHEVDAVAEKLKTAGKTAKEVNQELANDAAVRAATKVKQALDAQIADIEAWKAAQHAAYESGKTDLATWLAAEVHATDAAAIAHEDYLSRLVSIYTRSGNAEKLQAAQQQLATAQTKDAAEATSKLAEAEQKHQAAVSKIAKEYGDLVNAGVEKSFLQTASAVQKLTGAEEGLRKAQSKLKETQVASYYQDQEAAVQKLAAMHLITEQQMDDRLKLLQQKQANDALAILSTELAKEKSVIDAAQAKLSQAKASPFFSPAQLIELEAELKKAETAYTNTQSQIVAAQEKYNKQSETNDKSHYGRALLLAMSYGNQLLAEQLRENHALLLAAQANLADAKARGQDTTAIQQQITALKQNETQLQKEANGGKIVTTELQKNIQAALLAAQAELAQAKARGQNVTAIEQEISKLQQLQTLMQQAPMQMQKMQGGMQGLKMATQQLSAMMKDFAQQMSQAYATAIMGALESGKSVGAALEAATKQVLLQLATQALAYSLFYTAEGLANMFFDPPLATSYFAAAAEMALVAGVAGGVGLAMPGSGSGGGIPGGAGGGGLQNVGQTQSSGGSSQQTVGVTKLAAGGIVSQPTMFMAGDALGGGGASEAILPLSDPEVMGQVAHSIVSRIVGTNAGMALAAQFGGLLSGPTLHAAGAASSRAAAVSATSASPGGYDRASLEKFADQIGRHVARSSGTSDSGDTHLHIHTKGVLDSGTLKKTMKKYEKMVQQRRASFTSSNSLRITRRSQ